MDFPVDLNDIFTLNLNYSFEVLKEALDFLAKNQKLMGCQLADLTDGQFKPLSAASSQKP